MTTLKLVTNDMPEPIAADEAQPPELLTLIFRVDGAHITPLPGPVSSAQMGCIVVEDCDEPNVHHVAVALRSFVKSPAHLNSVDILQVVQWADIKRAIDQGTHAVAVIREE